MTKRIISICSRVFISVALILILLYIMRGKYAQIWAAIKGADMVFLILGLVVFFLTLVAASFRLRIIVNAQGGYKMSLSDATSLTFIGYFFNNFLPTSVGGDVAKVYYLSKKNSRKLSSFTSVFIDRAVGLVTMIFMAAIALLFVQKQFIDVNVRCMIYLITLCSLLGIVFLMNKNFARKFSITLRLIKPVEEKVKKAYNAIHAYKNHGGLMMKALALSVVAQLLFFMSISFLARSIGAVIPPMDILFRMPIICAVSMLPSINGLGVREGATIVLFAPVIGKESAFAVSILWLLILFIASFVGGIIYAISPQFKIKWGEVAGKEEML